MHENRRVVAVAYDRLCAFEFGIAAELFGLARPELDVPWYEFRVVTADPTPIRSTGGLELHASTNLRHVRDAGLVVLPGWKDKDALPPAPLVRALRAAHDRGARIMSICSGVYVLAATGLLNGCDATTHWRYTDHLAAMYPAIAVKPDVLYVDNGQTLTSAGSAAGIDLGLHMIRRDYGAAIAAEVARRLVTPPFREGGQSQFIRRTNLGTTAASDPFSKAIDWAEMHLDHPHVVADLAARAHMSTRTFARRFTAEIGAAPLAWLLAQRLRRAQELLETTNSSLGDIATATGFATTETMRHHFRKSLGTSPSRYRAAFARSGETPAVADAANS
jgi:AraC family transcriptional regulator, transcriptional activator FtrA